MVVRCAHSLCHCQVSPERLAQQARYCGDTCASEDLVPARDGATCGCGHDACAVNRSEEHHDHGSVTAIGEQYPQQK
jgi:hypothetical protein